MGHLPFTVRVAEKGCPAPECSDPIFSAFSDAEVSLLPSFLTVVLSWTIAGVGTCTTPPPPPPLLPPLATGAGSSFSGENIGEIAGEGGKRFRGRRPILTAGGQHSSSKRVSRSV